MSNEISSVAKNHAAIADARQRAVDRVHEVLRRASDVMSRVGPDAHETREIIRGLCGLPPEPSSRGYVQIGRVGAAPGGYTLVVKGQEMSPADLDAAMADACRLVRLIFDGVATYMAADDASAAERVRQYNACAQST